VLFHDFRDAIVLLDLSLTIKQVHIRQVDLGRHLKELAQALVFRTVQFFRLHLHSEVNVVISTVVLEA
jgi:hypothetical protein